MEPLYVEAEKEHFVACHLFNEEVMNNMDKYEAQYQKLEEERMKKEAEEAEKKKLHHKDKKQK